MKNLVFQSALICSVLSCLVPGVSLYGNPLQQDEKKMIAYVWEFKTRAGDITDLTRSITDEYEEVVIQKNCYTVLQRNQYGRLNSHARNEKALQVGGLSDSAKSKLTSLKANTVIFGEIFFKDNTGLVRISISIESLLSSQIIGKESILVHLVDLQDPRKLEAFMVELDKKVSKNLPCITIELIPQPLDEFEFEAADDFSVGMEIDRDSASTAKVHGQFGCSSVDGHPKKAGWVEFQFIRIPQKGNYWIRIRYSNDGLSDGRLPIKILFNQQVLAVFRPQLTGDWNQFVETELIPLGELEAGNYTIKFETKGSQYGVADLDKFTLYTAK